jgi:hypothetical protein
LLCRNQEAGRQCEFIGFGVGAGVRRFRNHLANRSSAFASVDGGNHARNKAEEDEKDPRCEEKIQIKEENKPNKELTRISWN